MSRSRLYQHRDDIRAAENAGVSVRALARTYGVAYSTMQEFLKGYTNRHHPLQKAQYDTLRHARQQAELSRQRVEEGL